MNTKPGKTIDRTPLRDGRPPLQSAEGNPEIFFQLVATDNNDKKIHPTTAQILRALYEGTIKSGEVSFLIVQINGKENVDFRDSSSLSAPTGCEEPTILGIPSAITNKGKSVTTACDPWKLGVKKVIETDLTRSNDLEGEL